MKLPPAIIEQIADVFSFGLSGDRPEGTTSVVLTFDSEELADRWMRAYDECRTHLVKRAELRKKLEEGDPS